MARSFLSHGSPAAVAPAMALFRHAPCRRGLSQLAAARPVPGLGGVVRRARGRRNNVAPAVSTGDYGTSRCASFATDMPHAPTVLSLDSINPLMRAMRYAVRGPLVVRAEQHAQAIRNGEPRPFEKVIFCNIGNPQSVGQKPVTLARQMLAACTFPDAIESAHLPADVKRRANDILSHSSGTGAYSESRGISVVRDVVVDFLRRRDGFDATPETIFLTNGASEGVKAMLDLVIRDMYDGIMIPIPQYPLYSAGITIKGGTQVGYYLDEARSWQLDINELYSRLSEARTEGVRVRALVIINPGNPTGQVLNKENLQQIVEFCETEQLILMADEVYQENIYGDTPFISLKQVVCEMDSPVELVSFHSTSKGMYGECGVRGGYMELHNFLPEIVEEVYKAVSVNLCANIFGQVMVHTMLQPPVPGEESYDLWKQEYDQLFQSLKRKATKLELGLNSIEGVSCNQIDGAMYAFPQITMPQNAINEAERLGMQPDAFYCFQLLDHTGVCVVPGSGFGQRAGTHHFRTTFLPPEDEIDTMLSSLATFHAEFLDKYG
eukprot:m.480129 g.480129  ORF g.480129 m.480129 type:complete len:550 (-) comp21709_c0_seq1:284-1933(-)